MKNIFKGILEVVKRISMSIGYGLAILLAATIMAFIVIGVLWVLLILPIKFLALFMSEGAAAIVGFCTVIAIVYGWVFAKEGVFSIIGDWIKWLLVEPFKKEK